MLNTNTDPKLADQSTLPISLAENKPLGFRKVKIIDSQKIIDDGHIIISNGQIQSYGPGDGRAEDCHWYDARGYWVTPGFINSHTHVAMSFLREVPQLMNKKKIIEDVFFHAEKNLSPKAVELFSYPSILAGLLSGVTSFVDHYYFSESVAKALVNIGLRGFVAETLADLSGAKPQRLQIEKWWSERQAKWHASVGDTQSLITWILGPHASDTSTKEYLEEIAVFAKKQKIPIHMHLSQTEHEFRYCWDKYKCSPVELAYRVGLLGSSTLAVHLVSSTQNDWERLQQTQTWVGLCPTSQIHYEKLAPIDKFYEFSLRGCLGTDCAASHDSMDLQQELRLYRMVLALRMRDGRGSLGSGGVEAKISALDVLKTVWDHPAEWLKSRIGRIETGYKADLVFWRRGLDVEPYVDPYENLVLSMSSRHVEHVMVNGEFRLFQKRIYPAHKTTDDIGERWMGIEKQIILCRDEILKALRQ